ncbi:MAG: reverse transcriptase-like protein [Candidatus Saccharibacteria bacterium]
MKALKLNHEFAQAIVQGKKTSTWRVNDDKDLHVNDMVTLIDKVDPLKPESWTGIGVVQISSILEKRLGEIEKNDVPPHELLPDKTELLKIFQGFYGPQINLETPVKIINFARATNTGVSFLESAESTIKSSPAEVQLFSDGGSRGNPGPSACGFALIDMKGEVIVEDGLFLGVTTNNQAEYQSLKLGLETALARHFNIVHVYMDSTLVVNQMNGIYSVKNRDLIPIHQYIVDLLPRFEKVIFTYIPRERNKRADAKVNEVLDAETKKSPG